MRKLTVAMIVLFCAFTTQAEARPAGCPTKWCGCWLERVLGFADKALWRARNWASVGKPADGPASGVVVVWPHHVGIITGQAEGKWIVKSGNDGNRVRERPRSMAGVIAFRQVEKGELSNATSERETAKGNGRGDVRTFHARHTQKRRARVYRSGPRRETAKIQEVEIEGPGSQRWSGQL